MAASIPSILFSEAKTIFNRAVGKNLLAIDPSLTCSGWAFFSIEKGILLGVGKIRSLDSSHPLPDRYSDLQGKIVNLFQTLKLSNSDVLICEAETTMRDPRAAFRVEQVRGIFETLARSHGALVPGRVNPRTIHYEVMGLKGKQLARSIVKDTAVQIVQAMFKPQLQEVGFPTDSASLKKHQDVVDAILIGHLSVTRVRSALQTGVCIEELFLQKRGRVSRKVAV